MEHWAIVLNNFCGYNEVYYFTEESLARKSFKKLCNKYKNFDEFEKTDDSASWFDCGYNEYSTYVTLEKRPIPLFNEVITDW